MERTKHVYPQKVGRRSDALCKSPNPAKDLESLKHAVRNGLDPNVLWNEDELLIPLVKSGCEIPYYTAEEDTWPHWNTPIHRALWIQDFDGAEILLQYGADINLLNSMGQTVLHEAVWHGRQDAIAFALEHGADPNKRTVGSQVRYKDRDMNLESEGDFLPLHFAILRGGNAKVISMLLDAETDLNATLFDVGWTFLDLALLACQKVAIWKLLFQNAPLSTCSPTSVSKITAAAYTDAARDLLAIVTSNRLVPPRHLYGVYCYSVREIKLSAWSGGDEWMGRIDNLVQTVFEKLREIANVKIAPTNIGLCSQCSKFEYAMSYLCGTGESFEFQLHRTQRHLANSASGGCPLCGLAADALAVGPDTVSGVQTPAATDQLDRELAVYFELRMYKAKPTDACKIFVKCGERTADLNFNYLDDSVMASMQIPDNLVLGTGSPKALLTAREWLHSCKSSSKHSACQEAYQVSTQFPARILYIAGRDCEPFLIEGQGIQAPYCALSYCWGTSSGFCTTRANLTEHMRAIPMNLFPAVMQDAIFTARELGFQYIWIDAVCIIQDDPDDWDREASIMHNIYSNADLTISSLVAKDSRDKLFLPRSLWTSYPVPLKIWPPKQYRPQYKTGKIHYPAVFPGRHPDKFTVQGPVHSRGWTLQEQLLSTRILYFGNGILHWDCLCKYIGEIDPTGCLGNWRFDQTILDFRSAKGAIWGCSVPVSTHTKVPQPYETWQSQLEIYSSRSITNPSDRLPAFLAISKRIQRIIGNEFLGGLWNGDRLLESLCWKTKIPVSGDAKMPSWTWASLAGEISFKYLDRVGRPDKSSIPNATVVSINIKTNKSQNQVSGFIRLKSTLYKMRDFEFENEEHKKQLLFKRKGRQSFDRQADVVGNYYALDILSFDPGPAPTGHGYHQWPHGRPPSTIRLLLQPLSNDLTKFRRIGIGIYDEENWDLPWITEDWLNGRRIEGDIILDYDGLDEMDHTPKFWLEDQSYFNKVVTIV